MVNTLGRTTVSGDSGIYTPARVLANDPGDDVLYGGGNYGDHEFGGLSQPVPLLEQSRSH